MAATPSMVLDDLVEPEDFPAWFTIGTVADFFSRGSLSAQAFCPSLGSSSITKLVTPLPNQ